jgi:hypothetical protein
MRATLVFLALAIPALPAQKLPDLAAMKPCDAAAVLEQAIETGFQELDDLRIKYVENHPDVRSKKARLAELESLWSAQITRAEAQNQPCSQATAGSPRRLVDLNLPGAMERLKRDNPAHYATVQAVLDSASRMPEGRAESYVRVTYRATDVLFSPLVLASDPPKTDLTFRLDDVVYRRLVTLRVSATPEPAASR